MVKMNIKREEILAVYAAGPEAVITLINTIIAESELPPPKRPAASRCIGFYRKNVERVFCSCFCSD